MLRTRLITAAILLPLLVLTVLKAPQPYFIALICTLAALCLYELYTMYQVPTSLKFAGIIIGVGIIIAYYNGRLFDALAAAILLTASLRLFLRPEPGGALKDTAPLYLGYFYVSLLLCFQIALYRAKPGYMLYLYGVIWSADAAAYFVGTRFGKHKLYQSMSPNKTMEGAVASLAGGVLGALLMGALFAKHLRAEVLLVTGLVLGALAVVGDLVESMIKRDAGVKDSGALVPGHGGLLDKIDGSVFAAPVLLWIFNYYGLLGLRFKLPF